MSTKVLDVIQPEIFTPYTINRTMELSALIQSGIAENNKEFNTLASTPNTLINMPFWNDLTGDPELMKDTGDTVPGKITANKDVAKKMAWTKSFGVNALSSLLSGSDPMKAIADLFAAYWGREYQKIMLATLDGVFAAASMAEKIHDITALAGDLALISGRTFIDATQKMGDAKDLLTGVMFHSAVEAYLAKNDLIQYKEDSTGKIRVKTFMGKTVIVDDSLAFDSATGAAESYLFGEGAIAWGNGSHPDVEETEKVRKGESLAGENILVNRRLSILHPRGVKWTDASVVDEFPSMAELATGTNWTRCYEPKKIRIVKFMFKTA